MPRRRGLMRWTTGIRSCLAVGLPHALLESISKLARSYADVKEPARWRRGEQSKERIPVRFKLSQHW